MRKYILSLLCLCFAVAAHPREVTPQDESEMLEGLTSWAVTLSGYAKPAVMPVLQYVPQEFFTKNACGGKACKVWGWYPNTGGNIVYVHEDARAPMFDGTDSRGLLASSIVVHEVVHYLQAVKRNFAAYACEDAISLEREAYGVQREYFTRYGRYYPIGISMHNSGCENTK